MTETTHSHHSDDFSRRTVVRKPFCKAVLVAVSVVVQVGVQVGLVFRATAGPAVAARAQVGVAGVRRAILPLGAPARRRWVIRGATASYAGGGKRTK